MLAKSYAIVCNPSCLKLNSKRIFLLVVLVASLTTTVARADSPDCGMAYPSPIAVVNTNVASQAYIETSPEGRSTDFWLYDRVCSATVTVQQGQKFVILTQLWRYAQMPDAYTRAIADFTVTVLGLGQPYVLVQHGDTATAPPAPSLGGVPWRLQSTYMSDSYYSREVVNVFDVSSLTQQGSITLTLRLEIVVPAPAPGYLERSPMSVGVGLYGATDFKLTQTPSAFRPRDAREPAASCSTADPSGQTHAGDCYPQYTATLTGFEYYQRSWYDDRSPLAPTITFTLVPATLPAPRGGPWLVGTSTNFGGDFATDPDYVFEEEGQPDPNLTVVDETTVATTPGSIPLGGSTWNPDFVATPPVTVKVTSRDFAGKAYLRAVLMLAPGAPPIYADVVDSGTGQNVTPPVNNAATGGTCGSDFAQHPFASLPVDQDCNGIADSWEAPYKGTTGYSVTADLDGGPGKPGDGFTVFDEYRGFHYVDDSWNESDDGQTKASKTRWASTDPAKKDVFFWDNDSKFTQALRSILAQKTPGIEFRRVGAVHANPLTKPVAGPKPKIVGPLNKNSPTNRMTYGYALAYVDQPVKDEPDTIGYSNGNVSLGQPIIINAAAAARLTYIDPVVALAVGLAHETGHVLGLCHSYDRLANLQQLPNPVTGLGNMEFVKGVITSTLPRANAKVYTTTAVQDRTDS